MSDVRLIAVLGYSRRRGEGIDETCSARLRRAEQEAAAGDVVLLSGWARSGSGASEAEQMARSWNGPRHRIVLDRRARSTVGNVVGAASLARTLGASEVILVTSGWHARRAGALLRSALRGSGSTVRLATTDEPGPLGARLRELACWTVVPFAALALTARRRSDGVA
jgi:uncharacterized SAM-binding protein YcdF (DUF218 family)